MQTSSNFSIWVVIVPALVTVAGTIATLVAARHSANRAHESEENKTETETIRLGVTELVDQLREERAELRTQVTQCQGECHKLREEVRMLKNSLWEISNHMQAAELEIRRLKIKAGEA